MAILDLPTIRPHKLSMATMMNQTMVITRITSEDGISGWGESTTIGGMTYGPESPEGMKLTIDQYIAPLLIGQDATNINLLMHKIEKNVKGNTFESKPHFSMHRENVLEFQFHSFWADPSAKNFPFYGL